ncbi:hypothetical protein [Azonexus hydrophilus]|uniref:Uncharacterized protein n=1 Tax=Azonexus hydrophilus TaxID=418702 RepID=A0ABZ2XNK8_9RHOO
MLRPVDLDAAPFGTTTETQPSNNADGQPVPPKAPPYAQQLAQLEVEVGAATNPNLLPLSSTPSKKGILRPKLIANTTLSLAIGPLVAFGTSPGRKGLGWRCTIALIFTLRNTLPGQKLSGRAYTASIHFFGSNVESERRDWIAAMRRKGYPVIQMATDLAVASLDNATSKRLNDFGLLKPASAQIHRQSISETNDVVRLQPISAIASNSPVMRQTVGE